MRLAVVSRVIIVGLTTGYQPTIPKGFVQYIGLAAEYETEGRSETTVEPGLPQEPEFRYKTGKESSVVFRVGETDVFNPGEDVNKGPAQALPPGQTSFGFLNLS